MVKAWGLWAEELRDEEGEDEKAGQWREEQNPEMNLQEPAHPRGLTVSVLGAPEPPGIPKVAP